MSNKSISSDSSVSSKPAEVMFSYASNFLNLKKDEDGKNGLEMEKSRFLGFLMSLITHKDRIIPVSVPAYYIFSGKVMNNKVREMISVELERLKLTEDLIKSDVKSERLMKKQAWKKVYEWIGMMDFDQTSDDLTSFFERELDRLIVITEKSEEKDEFIIKMNNIMKKEKLGKKPTTMSLVFKKNEVEMSSPIEQETEKALSPKALMVSSPLRQEILPGESDQDSDTTIEGRELSKVSYFRVDETGVDATTLLQTGLEKLSSEDNNSFWASEEKTIPEVVTVKTVVSIDDEAKKTEEEKIVDDIRKNMSEKKEKNVSGIKDMTSSLRLFDISSLRDTHLSLADTMRFVNNNNDNDDDDDEDEEELISYDLLMGSTNNNNDNNSDNTVNREKAIYGNFYPKNEMIKEHLFMIKDVLGSNQLMNLMLNSNFFNHLDETIQMIMLVSFFNQLLLLKDKIDEFKDRETYVDPKIGETRDMTLSYADFFSEDNKEFDIFLENDNLSSQDDETNEGSNIAMDEDKEVNLVMSDEEKLRIINAELEKSQEIRLNLAEINRKINKLKILMKRAERKVGKMRENAIEEAMRVSEMDNNNEDSEEDIPELDFYEMGKMFEEENRKINTENMDFMFRAPKKDSSDEDSETEESDNTDSSSSEEEDIDLGLIKKTSSIKSNMNSEIDSTVFKENKEEEKLKTITNETDEKDEIDEGKKKKNFSIAEKALAELNFEESEESSDEDEKIEISSKLSDDEGLTSDEDDILNFSEVQELSKANKNKVEISVDRLIDEEKNLKDKKVLTVATEEDKKVLVEEFSHAESELMVPGTIYADNRNNLFLNEEEILSQVSFLLIVSYLVVVEMIHTYMA